MTDSEIAREIMSEATEACGVRHCSAEARIAQALADARADARWRPIATAPKSTHEGRYVRGIYLLGYCPEEGIRPDGCICVIWWEPLQNGGEWVNEAGALVRPTHWMPLPEPPAAEEPAP